MVQYSHSRLSSFENCPLKFRYRYIDKLKTKRDSVEAFLGKRVHEILERLYHHVARHGRPPSLAQVLERFRKDWPRHWHADVHIVRTENPVEFYQNAGERCLENYYRSHYPFDSGETVGIEAPLSMRLDDEGRYRIRGIIDRLVRRAEGVWEIHDYKTSGSLPPRARLASDRQLALYQLGIEQTYPDVEQVELVWHYLLFDKTLRSSRSLEQLEKLRQDTIALIDEIEATTEFPPKPGPLCRWCEYADPCPEGGSRSSEDELAAPAASAPGLGQASVAAARSEMDEQLSLLAEPAAGAGRLSAVPRSRS